MEPKKRTPIPDAERGPEGEDPARRRGQEPVSPNPLPDDGSPVDDDDDERSPNDDKPARRRREEQHDPPPQADGDSTDEGDAGVQDAAKDAGLTHRPRAQPV